MKYRYTYLILLLCTAHLTVCAKPHYVFQSENPIANFAWDENDTSRYEGHYRYEQAYKMINDRLSTTTIDGGILDEITVLGQNQIPINTHVTTIDVKSPSIEINF